jgi:hypothetical protein
VIGVFGCFDTDALGDQVVVRVTRAELGRRLPGGTVRAFAPLGSLRPSAFDGGVVVEPLVPADAPLVRALDEVLALIVLTGDLEQWTASRLAVEYGLDAPTAARVAEVALVGSAIGAPRVWHAVSNVESVHATLPVLGSPSVHPGALAPSMVGTDVLERRLAFARAMGWCPAGEFVVAQCDEPAQAPDVAARARSAAGTVPVVLVPAGRDGPGIESLRAALSTEYVLPPVASVEDRIAVSHAALAVAATATVLDAIGAGADAARTLHDDYDAIAALVGGDTRAPLVLPELAAMRAALDARGRRLAAERLAFADALRAAHAERDEARAERDAAAALAEQRSPVESLRAGLRALARRTRRAPPT